MNEGACQSSTGYIVNTGFWNNVLLFETEVSETVLKADLIFDSLEGLEQRSLLMLFEQPNHL